MVEKRKLIETDEPAFYELAQYAFNKPDSAKRQEFFKQLYTHSAGFGVFDDGRLASGGLSRRYRTGCGVYDLYAPTRDVCDSRTDVYKHI